MVPGSANVRSGAPPCGNVPAGLRLHREVIIGEQQIGEQGCFGEDCEDHRPSSREARVLMARPATGHLSRRMASDMRRLCRRDRSLAQRRFRPQPGQDLPPGGSRPGADSHDPPVHERQADRNDGHRRDQQQRHQRVARHLQDDVGFSIQRRGAQGLAALAPDQARLRVCLVSPPGSPNRSSHSGWRLATDGEYGRAEIVRRRRRCRCPFQGSVPRIVAAAAPSLPGSSATL